MAETRQARVNAVPSPDRPDIPKSYGIAGGSEGMLSWDWASERLQAARNYWITTVRPDGRPHAMPVWGVWVDGVLYFSTGRRTVKARNLATDPRLVVHLESGDDCVVLEGVAEEVADPALLTPADAAYAAKYINPETGEGFRLVGHGDSPTFALRPRLAHAWREQDFPVSATRWHFDA